jgi:hypothetical protein
MDREKLSQSTDAAAEFIPPKGRDMLARVWTVAELLAEAMNGAAEKNNSNRSKNRAEKTQG